MSSMRDSMPQCAAFVDYLRAEFGADAVDPSIRAAVRDGLPTFYAEEGGHQLGESATLGDPARCVSVGVEQLAKGSRVTTEQQHAGERA